MNQQSDRHKVKRSYLSGAAKRRLASDKQKKENEILSKTRRLSDFFVSEAPSTSTCTESASSLEENISESMKTFKDSNLTKSDEKKQIEVQREQDQGLSSDVGAWPKIMKDNINYWIKNYSPAVQQCNDNLLLKEKSVEQLDGSKCRKCSVNMFQRKTKMGEIIHRSWLCFSPKTGRLYCFFCKLFDEPRDSQFTHDGFSDWKHASARLVQHETSSPHLKSVMSFNCLSKQSGRIDRELQKEIESTALYWRKVLKRVIDVILFLSERSLAFRGSNEILGSANNGNFLGIIELIAKYDPFLKEHLQKYGNCGSGKVNYLSSTIYEELIEEIGKSVQKEIINRISRARIYSVSLDGTSDEGHIDQLTIVLRYVENDVPVERFLEFLPNEGHKAQDMFNGLINFLNRHNINIKNCRGQSYDNASSMSGKFNGVQALVAKENELAIWVPCFAHSLNLVGEKASDSSVASTNYFMFLQSLFVFFVASNVRWTLLIDNLKSHQTGNRVRVPQRVDCTRWSSRADANKSFIQNYLPIRETLLNILENNVYDAKTRCEAQGLYNNMCQLETGIMATFWDDVLQNLNRTSKTVQSSEVLLNTAIACIRSLKELVAIKRYNFSHYERLGAELTEITDYKNDRVRRRNVRLNPLDYGTTPAAQLIPSESFRIFQYIPLIDTFVNSLDQRISAYEEIESRFKFLSNFENLSTSEISESAEKLINIYKDDLDTSLGLELLQFKEFCNGLLEYDVKKTSREQAMYSLIIKKGIRESFPNVEMVLRIYLTLMISNCTGERSFSKLKIIKNASRTSMGQNRLNFLTLLSTERDVVREINVDKIINNFADRKARKQFI